ncbi:barstar family protein [Serratia sp. AKBS12]|uniref:barstar family protein n=1 Tax=Serratia sp. AKBS12 TaxID=2974597 RepID=UPI002166B2BD|nr:barstar family protein [Serratia sp. AKBS12]MCS3406919.1 barstar family protein [Serratia sp. AKBS12]HEI8867127.1 barstar family protein [Serratia odorifera]
MGKVEFDFSQIPDPSAFYRDFAGKFALGEEFGANLDALWDVVTGDIGLPVEIEFVNLDNRRKRRFGAIILLFEEAEEELEGSLRFNIREDSSAPAHHQG